MSLGGMRRPPSPPAGWRSIRPWNRLTLHVREITPVSVTFILSSSIALRTWDDTSGDDFEDSDHAGPSHLPPPKLPMKPISMSELLGKGLAVKVNNAPWQRVVMHIDDDADVEAIVILYGLHPARTYDVELALVAGEETIRGKISTDVVDDGDDAVGVDDSLEEEAPILPVSNSAGAASNGANTALAPTQTLPTTPTPTPPDPPLQAPRAMTVEERASQLLHELTALDNEKEQLIVRLKTARRDSQKADAALRSEIEALKRASERSAQMDQRSRQKILALQEATKQCLAASVDADAQVKLVEASLPALEERAKAVSLEYQRVKEKATKDHTTAAEAIKADKKYVGEMEGELASLRNRLERLNTRKDKLVMETVPDLEKELRDLGQKIEETERSADDFNDEPHDQASQYPIALGTVSGENIYSLPRNPLASPQDMASRGSLPPLSTGPSALASHRSPIGTLASPIGRIPS